MVQVSNQRILTTQVMTEDGDGPLNVIVFSADSDKNGKQPPGFRPHERLGAADPRLREEIPEVAH